MGRGWAAALLCLIVGCSDEAAPGAPASAGTDLVVPTTGETAAPSSSANGAAIPPVGTAATPSTAASENGESPSSLEPPAMDPAVATAQETGEGSDGGAAPTGDGGQTTPEGDADASEAGDDLEVSGEDESDSALCNVGVYDGTTPQTLALSGDTFAHDPTMIEVDGVFYRFWTGDFIPMATSSDLRTWRNGPSVYGRETPDWARRWLAGVPGQTFNFPWAPDVSYFGGRYHLYSSFSAKFGDNISCITHLTTDDIAQGDWTDHGPVICTEGNEQYNAIDADVGLDADGNPYLAFGSFWDGIMAFPLDEEGNRVGTDLTRLAWAREIEAPVLFRRCGYYYLFVTFGLCCPGQNRRVSQLTYRVAVGRSENIMGPYLDREGRPLLEGGGTLMVEGNDEFAAAGHSDVLVHEDKIYHLYHAYRLPGGGAELRIVEMPFDEEGWPVPAGP